MSYIRGYKPLGFCMSKYKSLVQKIFTYSKELFQIFFNFQS